MTEYGVLFAVTPWLILIARLLLDVRSLRVRTELLERKVFGDSVNALSRSVETDATDGVIGLEDDIKNNPNILWRDDL